MKKNILTGLIFLLFIGSVFATTTMGEIYTPAENDNLGHTFTADFNFADDVDVNYNIKGIVVTLKIGDVNVLTDYNTASAFTSGLCFFTTPNTGQARCQLPISTSLIRTDGAYTLTAYGVGGDDLVTDSNTSASFNILRDYAIANDGDIDSYNQGDMEDLTESGIGTGLRQTILWIGTAVFFIVISGLLVYGATKIKKM